eukprot:Sspe_Gene.18611::Locus_6703_Transcript_1_1_Confidence_1.000_Length_1818::g.18611::m.18611/K03327/TC.MATE, SLC47A, norM, mdtK, dinF; multidrug resistance protein, MATE family
MSSVTSSLRFSSALNREEVPTGVSLEDPLSINVLLDETREAPFSSDAYEECSDGCHERTSLLPDSHHPDHGTAVTRDDDASESEFVKMIKLGSLVALAMFGRMAMNLTDISVVGHIGTDELSAAATANIWITITSFFTWRGLSPALKTLASAALGAKNNRLVGKWLQLALAVAWASTFLIGASWLASYPVYLHLFGLSEHEAKLAAKFTHLSVVWMPAQVTFTILANFFQALNIVAPMVVVTLVCCVLNLGFNFLFVWGIPGTGWDGLGFTGAPLATAVSRWIQLLAFVFYTLLWKRHISSFWYGWEKDALRGGRLRQFALLALPLTVGGLLEELQLQTVAMFAVHLGKTEIATHNAVLYLFLSLAAALAGLMTAVNVRASYHLGNNDPASAKRVGWLGIRMAASVAVVVAAIFFAIRKKIGHLFSNDPEVWRLSSKVITIMAGAFVCLCMFFVTMGLLTALQRTGAVAVAFLFGAWGVSVPMAYVYAYKLDLGLPGLWYGLVCGYFVVIVTAGISVIRSDFAKSAERISSRARGNGSAERRRMVLMAVVTARTRRGDPLHPEIAREVEDWLW